MTKRLQAERDWWLEHRARLDTTEVSYRSRRLIEIRYGLDTGQIVTLEAAGEHFKIGKERTRQLLNQAKRIIEQHVREDRPIPDD